METGFHVRRTPRSPGRLLARQPRTAAAPIRFVKVSILARATPEPLPLNTHARLWWRGVAYNTPCVVVVVVVVAGGGWIRASNDPPKTCFGCSRSVGDTRPGI